MSNQMASDRNARIDRATGTSLADTLTSATLRNTELMKDQSKAQEIRRATENVNNISAVKDIYERSEQVLLGEMMNKNK
ncbi:MAG: hypothetical protein HQK53_16495 [Oligoflexia bacterium]|nr:hypothetical protein [Oligoflexia bacterium]